MRVKYFSEGIGGMDRLGELNISKKLPLQHFHRQTTLTKKQKCPLQRRLCGVKSLNYACKGLIAAGRAGEEAAKGGIGWGSLLSCFFPLFPSSPHPRLESVHRLARANKNETRIRLLNHLFLFSVFNC